MKHTQRLLCAAVLLGAGTVAHADMYVGGGLYSAALDVAVGDDNATAPAIHFGWRPIELVGVEIGYHDLGDYEILGEDASAKALTLAGLLSFELGPVGLYAKAGIADATLEYAGEEESSNEPFGGIGATIDVLDKLYVYAEFLRFSPNDDVDIDVTGLGLRYAF